MTKYQIILCICFIATGLISLISNIILAIYTGKKFDQLLVEKNLPLPANFAFLMPDRLSRAMYYAIKIQFFNNPSKNTARYKRYYKLYGNFNFKAHASNKDLLLSKIFLYLTSLFIVALFAVLFSAFFHIK